MSINALVNQAAARRPDFYPENSTPKSLAEIAQVARTSPGEEPSASIGGESASTQIDTALNVLFGYIPTEIVTLYVAVLAAVQTPNKVTPSDWIAFWSFLVATPIVVWLGLAAKVKAQNKTLPLRFRTWPLWEMAAGTVAYVAWAFALPNTPFGSYPWYSSPLSGVAVLAASTGLGLIAPFFQRSLPTT